MDEKERDKNVDVFLKYGRCLTYSLSAYCNICCFVLQKCSYHFLIELFLQNLYNMLWYNFMPYIILSNEILL